MLEFMLGLVAIMILLMGLNQIASIVYYDFTTIVSAREEVADDLVSRSPGTEAIGSDLYNFDTVRPYFQTGLNPNNELASELSSYPSDRENQFDFLWNNDNPLQEMTSAEKSSSIPVTAPLFQRVIGRGTVQIGNAVYMPPWESYLND